MGAGARRAILAAVLALPAALAAATRGIQRRLAFAGAVLALLLVGNELVWWVYRYRAERGSGLQSSFAIVRPDVWAGAVAGWRRRQGTELSLAGLAGGGMALLTPDLWAPWPSYPSTYYFLSHGLTVVMALFLVWGARMRLTAWALGRFLLAINCYGLAMGVFNAVLPDQLPVPMPKTGGGHRVGLLGTMAVVPRVRRSGGCDVGSAAVASVSAN